MEGQELIKKVEGFDADEINGIDLKEFEKGIQEMTVDQYYRLGDVLSEQNEAFFLLLGPALDEAKKVYENGGYLEESIKHLLVVSGKIEDKEDIETHTYIYKDGKLYINGIEIDIDANSLCFKDLSETIELRKQRFEKIYDSVYLFTSLLEIHISKDTVLNSIMTTEQKRKLNSHVEFLYTQLTDENREKIWNDALVLIADPKQYEEHLKGIIDNAIPSWLIDIGNNIPQWGEKNNIYGKIKQQIELFLVATEKDEGRKFNQVMGEISFLGRGMIGREGSDLLVPGLEEYILNNESLRGLKDENYVLRRDAKTKQREERPREKFQIENSIAMLQDMFVNVIQTKVEKDGDLSICEDFINAVNNNTIPQFFDSMMSSIPGNRFIDLPPKVRGNLLRFAKEYGQKYLIGMEKQKIEMIKNTKKSVGMQIYLEYLGSTPEDKNHDLLKPGNEKQLHKNMEYYGTVYEEYGSFRSAFYKTTDQDNPRRKLLDIEKEKAGDLMKNEMQSMEYIYNITRNLGMYNILRSVFTRTIVETYKEYITGKDERGSGANRLAGKFSGPGDYIAKAHALEKMGVSPRIQGIAEYDNKIKTYIDIVGLGTLTLSDKQVDGILYRTKEIGIQVVLIVVSAGLANLVVKGVMMVGSRIISSINTANKIKKGISLAEKVTIFYKNANLLSKGTKRTMRVVDTVLEGAAFHVFMTLAGGVVYKQLPEDIKKELGNVRGYAHSIAFIGVMRAIGGLSSIGTKRGNTKFSELIKQGKISQDAVANIMRGVSFPIEVGTMAGTEFIINFSESLITGEEMTPVDLIHTTAIVLGLRIAHAPGNPFKKVEQFMVTKMTKSMEGKIIELEYKQVIKEVNKDKKQKGKNTQKKIVLPEKSLNELTIKEREGMGLKEKIAYIEQYKLRERFELQRGLEVEGKKSINDFTMGEMNILFGNIWRTKSLYEKASMLEKGTSIEAGKNMREPNASIRIKNAEKALFLPEGSLNSSQRNAILRAHEILIPLPGQQGRMEAMMMKVRILNGELIKNEIGEFVENPSYKNWKNPSGKPLFTEIEKSILLREGHCGGFSDFFGKPKNVDLKILGIDAINPQKGEIIYLGSFECRVGETGQFQIKIIDSNIAKGISRWVDAKVVINEGNVYVVYNNVLGQTMSHMLGKQGGVAFHRKNAEVVKQHQAEVLKQNKQDIRSWINENLVVGDVIVSGSGTQREVISVKDSEIRTKNKNNNNNIEVFQKRELLDFATKGNIEKIIPFNNNVEIVKSNKIEVPQKNNNGLIDINTSKKNPHEIVRNYEVVFIGDLHGEYIAFKGNLEATGLIDAKGNWVGGNKRVIFQGDILADRGTDGLRIISEINKLRKQAKEKGGEINLIVGNHEDFLISFLTNRQGIHGSGLSISGFQYGWQGAGITELARFNKKGSTGNELSDFMNLSKGRIEIINNMRKSPEGKIVLEEICNMKVIVQINDVLIFHTNPTDGMLKYITQGNLQQNIKNINETYQGYLRKVFLGENNNYTLREFNQISDLFLDTGNRSTSTNVSYYNKLNESGINYITHGHNSGEGKMDFFGNVKIIDNDYGYGKYGSNTDGKKSVSGIDQSGNFWTGSR